MKPQLLIVDDIDAAFQLLDHPSRAGQFDLPRNPTLGWMRNNESAEKLIAWFATGVPGDEGTCDQLAIILDLGFRGASEKENMWPSVEQQLSGRTPYLDGISSETRDGFAVLQALRKCPWLKTAAVVIASGRTSSGIPQIIDAFNRLFRSEGKSIIVSAELGRRASDDSEGYLLGRVAQLWTDNYGLHPDPVISSFLSEYGAPFREPATAKAAWRHDGWCKTQKGQKAAQQLLGTVQPVDSSSISSLFMVASDRIDFDHEDRS